MQHNDNGRDRTAVQGDGTDARSPWQMPWGAWKQVGLRTWQETSNDNVGLIAAGVAFYGFLALVPLLGAIVLTYGLVADPQTVTSNMTTLTSVLPEQAARLIGEQLLNVVQTSDGKKGFGLLVALAIALFGARNAAGAVVTALNIAYEEEETRGFIHVTLLALGITACAVLVAILAMVSVTVLGFLQTLLPTLPDWVAFLGKVVTYLLLAVAGSAGAATLYRYGPDRRHARWTWLTPGSLLAALLWLVLTVGFGIYVANFGNYDATYGSIGTVVVLLTWMYLSAYILLFGAELNSELEHQTARDTTRGSRPIGERGAWVADHVAGKASPEEVRTASPGELNERSVSGLGDYAAARATTRATRLAGLEKVGVTPSIGATLGLALLRREGRALPGAALLAGAGLLAWASRRGVEPAVEAVIFDIDGTLVDSNDYHVWAWSHAFHEHGYEIAPAHIHDQIGKGGDLLVPALIADVSEAEIEALSTRHDDIFKSRYLDRVRAFPGAADLLRHVAGQGQKVALASSASKEELDHYVDLLGIRDIVSAATSKDDADTTKPAPDIFAAAMKKLGVAPAAARVVGDTPYDVSAAAKCGIATVAVSSGGFSDQVLNRAGARAIYDDVAHILRDYRRSPLAR
ncbi:YhjD/YihY/BrkB family envelope integrity protein [uncultured Sphingomonas sp.]|uniref:YhjD/YihY/BrkB family envelope integrity protein n=1 Tax=uncultured Sphingomonas sp. TaxID=158754 RepID=UPI0025F112A1|nr:YhjD/YihY/BrkB family envelope integrity protein [uncultured Sphingomonas sp.]